MTPGTGVEPSTEPRIRSRLEPRWRWVLLLGWLAVLVAALATGTREAGWRDLRDAVRSGDVTSVSTTRGLGPHTLGSAPVEVTWREGIVRHRTEMREVRPLRHAAAPRVVADVDDALTALQPGLTVTHHEWGTSSAEVLGWRVSGWFAWLGVTLGLFTLVLLITQPEPWRSTRWAWFWLIWSAPGLAAYLLLGGPTGVLPPPSDPERRLTGGWAFLLAILVSTATSAVVRGVS